MLMVLINIEQVLTILKQTAGISVTLIPFIYKLPRELRKVLWLAIVRRGPLVNRLELSR